MLIINADDWGRSAPETDSALACHRQGRITSVSAMVFMGDSRRSAELAKEHGVDAGLHLNLSQHFTHPSGAAIAKAQDEIVRFMVKSKYSVLVYHPNLRRHFREVYEAQAEEFERLYKVPPSHVDGHQHLHLCANLLFDSIIPTGQKVRRNFTFFRGEKPFFNRLYRRMTDAWIARKYVITDYFFSLGWCLQANRFRSKPDLAKVADVEIMTHPVHRLEYDFLMSDSYSELLEGVKKGSYTLLQR